MNEAIKRGLKAAGVIGAASLALVQSAHAELPAGVTTGITGAQADGLTVIGALAAAGAAVFIIHKLLKRFGVSL